VQKDHLAKSGIENRDQPLSPGALDFVGTKKPRTMPGLSGLPRIDA
jgi:hypothetical protein